MHYPQIPWWQRLVQKLASIEVISSRLLSKNLHKLDNAALSLSRGKRNLTTMLTGLPVVVITTTGARSGMPRTIPLAGIPDGEKIILVPTHFGQKTYPGWYYNLQTNPRAHLHRNGDQKEYIARIADLEEQQRYWDLAVHYYPGYEAYQKRSGGRKIPLFILEPTE